MLKKMTLLAFVGFLLGGCCTSICDEQYQFDSLFFLGFNIDEIKSSMIYVEMDGEILGDTIFADGNLDRITNDLYRVPIDGIAGNLNSNYLVEIGMTGEVFTISDIELRMESCQYDCLFNKKSTEREVLGSYRLNGVTLVDNEVVLQR